ncbi:elicitor-responsive protein 1-like [Heracleum sosnowskyi]|uniref:Elicitor-responsive protein 1-like n=1 Tax=Heracleum sosnowskyi TaxID=360622 RepID=A0AAD8H3G3_9APIA|nr:elicitor-responsive protein 1-like [Heracleum sosnowskyi]
MATPVSGIHGQLLEVTIVGCSRLKDTEWFSRQDPYVCVEYGSSKFSTRTCTDGGKNPTFQEKFVFTLIEGLREINVLVWNSNTVTFDDLIGTGRIQLQKVLSQGYDDGSYSIQSKTGKYAGEVRVILHFSNVSKPAKNHASSAPYGSSPVPQPSGYGYPPPASSGYGYPPPASGYPQSPAYPAYPQNPAAYPPTPYPNPHSAAYPPTPYAPPAAYPPSPYPPPAGYPPSPFPPAQPSNHYPPGPYPGTYHPPY